MNELFEKDEKGNKIPLINKNINKENFISFFNKLVNLKISECISLLEELKNIIIKSPQIGQIILDFNEIYNSNEKGFIEILIEKYLFFELDSESKMKLEKFFQFISNPFQINKNIYDFIYQIIGKMFCDPVIINFNHKTIFEDCLNLLKIFYNKSDIEYDNFKDNFFYLYDNEIKTNINKDNMLKYKFINISFFIYINDYYKNNESIISKILFLNNNELLMKLKNFNIELFYNNELIGENNEITLIKDKWNLIQLNINEDKILININKSFSLEKKECHNESIIDLTFFSKFHGLTSPIIISKEDLTINQYFSKSFIQDLYETERIDFNNKEEKNKIKIKKTNEEMNRISSDSEKGNDEISDNEIIHNYYNFITIPFIIFLPNKKDKIEVSFNKNKFPFLYSFNHYYYKENIFLIGGTKNILPLFELLFKLFNNDIKFEKILNDIIEIITSILYYENNIDDFIISNSFQIYFLFLEKIEQIGDESILEKNIPVFKILFNSNKNDMIYINMKKFLNEDNIVRFLFKKEIGFSDFLLHLHKYKNNGFQFLINFLLHTKDKKNEIIFDEIFNYFNKYFKHKKNENIIKIIGLLKNESLDNKIIEKTFNVLIKFIDITLSDKKMEKIINNKKMKFKTNKTGNNIEDNKIINKSNTSDDKNEDIENKKVKIKHSNTDKSETKNSSEKKEKNKKKSTLFLELMTNRIENEYKNAPQNNNQNEDLYSIYSYLKKGGLNFWIKLLERKKLQINLQILNFFQIILINYLGNLLAHDPKKKKIYLKQYTFFKVKKQENKNEIKEDLSILENYFKQLLYIDNTEPYDNNKQEINNKIPDEIIKDFEKIMNLSIINFQINEKDLAKFKSYKIDLLYHIEKLLIITRKAHIYNLDDSQKISIPMCDFYLSKSFISLLIPLYHHIYLLCYKLKIDNTINEIGMRILSLIKDIIYEIYLFGIDYGFTPFLLLIHEFDSYYHEQKYDKHLENFKNYFFQEIYEFECIENKDFFEKKFEEFKNDISDSILENKYIDWKELYSNIKNKYKKKKIFENDNEIILENPLLRCFILHYELVTKSYINVNVIKCSKEDNSILIDFILLISLCIILYGNNEYKRITISNKGFFFIRIIFLGIKFLLFKIYKQDNSNFFLQAGTVLISIFHFFIIENKKSFFEKIFKVDKKFEFSPKLIDNFQKIYEKFEQKNPDFKEIQKLFFEMKDEILPLFKELQINEPNEINEFPKFLNHNCIKGDEKEINDNESYEKNDLYMIRKMILEKRYRKIRKELFSWNNSYSYKELFYSEDKKKTLKFKILNHYSEEMTLPLLIPILNINSYIPPHFKQFFNEKYKPIDLIGESILDENYDNIIKQIKLKNEDNNYTIKDEDILSYFKLNNYDLFSCCLIKQGLHIPGYIFRKGEEFSFIGFPRQLNDVEKLYCDEFKDNLCHGSLYKLNKIYFLNIRLENIIYSYKKNYCFKDDAVEFFTKQNKSYYFEFINIGNYIDKYKNKQISEEKIITEDIEFIKVEEVSQMGNLENENLKNSKKNNENKNYLENPDNNTNSKNLIDSKLKINEEKNSLKLNFQRNKFFDFITKGNSIEDINYYYKGKSTKYNNEYSIQKNFILGNISKLEFLMRINLLSNRSFKDLNQYPVFPWILKDYSETNIISEERKSKIEIDTENKFEFIDVNKIFYINDQSENENISKENNLEIPKETSLETSKENNLEKPKDNNLETSKETSLESSKENNLESPKENNLETSKETSLTNKLKNSKKYVILRPMDFPIGKLEETRFKAYKAVYEVSYEEFKEFTNEEIPLDFSDYSKLQKFDMQIIPIYYGTHYSNPAYVCHYLTRIFPYCLDAQLIQGDNFDAPDRLFINLSKSYFSVENTKCDLRELIPELYYLPDLFRNINHLKLGNLQISNKSDSTFQILKKKYNINDNNVRVEDVVLPNWSMENPEKFICINRELFEKNEINIEKWINLIFGVDQKGKNALEKTNIFSPYCYIGFINLEKMKNLNERQLIMKFFDLGMNPIQLFDKPLKNTKVYKDIINFPLNNINSNYKEVIEKCKIDIDKKKRLIKSNIEDFKNKQKQYESSLKSIDSNISKLTDLTPKIIENEITLNQTENFYKIIYDCNYSFDCMYYRYNKNKIYIFYNFKSGEIFIYFNSEENFPIEIKYKTNKKLFSFFNLDNSEITSICVDNYYILFGTKLGSIIIIKNPYTVIDKILHYHTKKITSICHNYILHLMISSSEDGYINIHTIPNFTLVNSIYDNNFIPNKIIISYTPLPSFIIYKSNGNLFRVYSINGRKLLNEDKVIDDVKELNIGKNNSFIEYLKVNDKDIVYKLPYLEETEYHQTQDEKDKEEKKIHKTKKHKYKKEIEEIDGNKEKNNK